MSLKEEKCHSMTGIRKTKQKLALIPEDRRYYLLIHNEQKDVESLTNRTAKCWEVVSLFVLMHISLQIDTRRICQHRPSKRDCVQQPNCKRAIQLWVGPRTKQLLLRMRTKR